jgi:diguanylate cyclase (GGDEF)-like protein/putative nucleotidyltransferase with HDIG domain
MTARPTAALSVLVTGTALAAVLVALFRTGTIGESAFQAGFTVLLLLGAALVLTRAVRRPTMRRGWLALGAAVLLGMTSNALTGWTEIGLDVPEALSMGLAGCAFVLSVTGLAFMLMDRPSRLPLGAALDGMTGALVAQAVIAVLLLEGVKHDLQDGFDIVVLLYPLGDVVLMGLVAAAVAHGGWRVDAWLVCLAGLVALTVGDSGALSTSILGPHQHGESADLGWLAGAWLIAAGAWAPDPRRAPERWVRSAVPVGLAAAALVILILVAFDPEPLIPALACAVAALAVVVGRLAFSLHDNADMLSHAQSEATTDALTGLANRRQLLADLEDEIAHATLERPAALALYDLNGFKDYNDTFGHPAGDALLAALGVSLSTAVGADGTAYRMGGDEFCIIVRSGAEDPWGIAEQATEALSAGTRGFKVTAALGVVLLPTEAATGSEALRRADLRMYEHKSGGRIGSRRQVTQALMLAMEERDRTLTAHGAELQELAGRVAQRLGLCDADTEAVRLGAVLHDVGKLAIPDRILDKPGPLDDVEWQLMRRHTLVGERILEGAPALHDVAGLVRSSHERFDGAGYPDGLAGTDIPLGARIIAVCDAFDAMTRSRVYRDPMTVDAAVEELLRCAGTHFDPDVVDAFTATLAARPAAVLRAS